MDEPTRRAAQALYRLLQAAIADPDQAGLQTMLLKAAQGDLDAVISSGHPLVPLLLELNQARDEAGITPEQVRNAMEELHPELRTR